MTTADDLTGEPLTDLLLGPACDLVDAVAADDGPAATTALQLAAGHAGGAFLGAAGVALILAAALPEDLTVSELLAWTHDRERYAALRAAGMTGWDARARIAWERAQRAHSHRGRRLHVVRAPRR